MEKSRPPTAITKQAAIKARPLFASMELVEGKAREVILVVP